MSPAMRAARPLSFVCVGCVSCVCVRCCRFREWDVDGDGGVTPAELHGALHALGSHVERPESDAFFASLDRNGTGRLDLQEVNAALRRSAVAFERAAAAAAKADVEEAAGGDGGAPMAAAAAGNTSCAAAAALRGDSPGRRRAASGWEQAEAATWLAAAAQRSESRALSRSRSIALQRAGGGLGSGPVHNRLWSYAGADYSPPEPLPPRRGESSGRACGVLPPSLRPGLRRAQSASAVRGLDTRPAPTPQRALDTWARETIVWADACHKAQQRSAPRPVNTGAGAAKMFLDEKLRTIRAT